MVKYLIGKFDQCWIPDFPKEDSLAGNLVHQYSLPSNAVLIGPLSRFDSISQEAALNIPQQTVLGIISGPEPQRSIFEELLQKALAKREGKHTLINGQTNGHKANKEMTNPVLMNHLPTQEMIRLIQNHKVIISRSGYSTIMDMYFLNRSIIMVPTPGQTEQKYLARLHHGRRHQELNQNQINGTEFSITIDSPIVPGASSKKPLTFRTVLKSILQNPCQITTIRQERQPFKTASKRLSKK
ncbi:glycosyltransferase [Marinilabilia salmonicolor]|nr:glycosyltransferase [Marinilabilia salmonicolor]